MAYCVYTDVASQLKRITDAFGSTSTPTSTEVTAFIALIDAEIDSRIGGAGIVVPVVGTSALARLKQISINGTAALVCRAVQMDSEEAKVRQDLFDKAIEEIIAKPSSLGATSGVSVLGVAGSTAEDPRPFTRTDAQW
jgi:hypothetical protein